MELYVNRESRLDNNCKYSHSLVFISVWLTEVIAKLFVTPSWVAGFDDELMFATLALVVTLEVWSDTLEDDSVFWVVVMIGEVVVVGTFTVVVGTVVVVVVGAVVVVVIAEVVVVVVVVVGVVEVVAAATYKMLSG